MYGDGAALVLDHVWRRLRALRAAEEADDGAVPAAAAATRSALTAAESCQSGYGTEGGGGLMIIEAQRSQNVPIGCRRSQRAEQK